MPASVLAQSGADPSAAGADLAWQTPGGTGVLARPSGLVRLGGTHPALGGGLLGQRVGDAVRIVQLDTGGEVATIAAAGAGPFAVSARWVVVRIGDAAGDRLEAISLADGSRRAVAATPLPAQLGRPALDGDLLVFHEARPSGSRIQEIDLATGAARTLRRREGIVLLNPSLRDGRLVYVQATAERQRLRIGSRTGRRDANADRTLHDIPPTARRDAGHEPGRGRHRAGYRSRRAPRLPERPAPGVVRSLWTTAIGERHALVARLSHQDDGSAASVLLRAPLAG